MGQMLYLNRPLEGANQQANVGSLQTLGKELCHREQEVNWPVLGKESTKQRHCMACFKC